jgi:hypothetical protein
VSNGFEQKAVEIHNEKTYDNGQRGRPKVLANQCLRRFLICDTSWPVRRSASNRATSRASIKKGPWRQIPVAKKYE